MIFEKERERNSVLYTGYRMIFEKERERLSVLYTGDQMIFEKERERNFRKISLSLFHISSGNQ
jgi:hypothetical protein